MFATKLGDAEVAPQYVGGAEGFPRLMPSEECASGLGHFGCNQPYVTKIVVTLLNLPLKQTRAAYKEGTTHGLHVTQSEAMYGRQSCCAKLYSTIHVAVPRQSWCFIRKAAARGDCLTIAMHTQLHTQPVTYAITQLHTYTRTHLHSVTVGCRRTQKHGHKCTMGPHFLKQPGARRQLGRQRQDNNVA